MAMNEGGVTVVTQKIIRGPRIEIHQIVLALLQFFQFCLLALLAQRSGNGFAFTQRLVQKGHAPDRITNLGAKCLVVLVVGTQHVAVRKDKLPGRQRQHVRIRQRDGSTASGEFVAEQEVAIAVHQQQLDAGVGQCAQTIDDSAIESVLGIIDTIIARPDIKEIAEDVEILGGTGTASEKIKKDAGDAGCLRREVQV